MDYNNNLCLFRFDNRQQSEPANIWVITYNGDSDSLVVNSLPSLSQILVYIGFYKSHDISNMAPLAIVYANYS